MRIPQIIHQTFEDENYPSFFAQLSETWKKCHPGWSYEFWNRKRMNTFVQQEYPQYWTAYCAFKYNVQRWDAFRYLILDRFGGLYADADYECLESFDNLLKGKTCCFSSEPKEHIKIFNQYLFFNNALMACIPSHPFMRQIIDAVFDKAVSQADYPNKMAEVLSTTGPLMISSLYQELKGKDDIYIIPEELASPLTKFDVQIYMSGNSSDEFKQHLEQKLSKAKAVHYFLGTWL